jgi:hypothetical protein
VKNSLQKLLMALWLALLAMVLVLEVCFVLVPHAQAMLPNIAGFTLNHELSCVGIFLCRKSEREICIVEYDIPFWPHIQRVIPCSSGSSS